MWPHFMEKRHKPKDQIYVSRKVLGQLYDLVERVDFVPELEAPFDARILGVYNLDRQILHEAAEMKAIYDAAMHRIMAQHEIRTEHEVWSTFVLQHANQSKDFKFHDEIGAISASLKDRFRAACYEKAGGTEFAKIGPFVAAMYRVTSDELIHALEECRQARNIEGKEAKVRQRLATNMPLMSFPWLFSGILGKIANGELTAGQETIDDFASNTSGQPKKPGAKRKSEGFMPDREGDTLRTMEGLVHRGELLRLFVDADQPQETASKLMTEVTASSSSPKNSHDKVSKTENPSNDGLKHPNLESLALLSKELASNDDGNKKLDLLSVSADSLTSRTLIDFDVTDELDEGLDIAPQVPSIYAGNTGPKIIGSLRGFEFGNEFKEFESKSLSAIHSSQDHSQAPAIDLLSLEDVVDRPAAGQQYTSALCPGTQIGTSIAERHSNESALAVTTKSERGQLGKLTTKHDCDIYDPSVLVHGSDEFNLPSASYSEHDACGLEVMGGGNRMRALKDEGAVEEEVVLTLDDKPSLLERLALFDKE
ncbi:Protein rrf1 [Xylographa opegraphella]|nr:Protein rrf1 [Xylographa opegraphella]